MADEEITAVKVARIDEFAAISEYMQDADLDKALDYVVKLIEKPDIPIGSAHTVIVQLQAISARLGMQAAYYTNLERDSKRKNIYYSARDNIDRLVDALKYVAKARF